MNIARKQFGEVDISQPFFHDFRKLYPEFNEWAARKCDDPVYVVDGPRGLLGFLKLKIEDTTEDYSDFSIPVIPKRRLKICSLKSTMPGLGNELMKVVAYKMIAEDVDEVYATIKHKCGSRVHRFLIRHGFSLWCRNTKTLELVYRYERNHPSNQKDI